MPKQQQRGMSHKAIVHVTAMLIVHHACGVFCGGSVTAIAVVAHSCRADAGVGADGIAFSAKRGLDSSLAFQALPDAVSGAVTGGDFSGGRGARVRGVGFCSEILCRGTSRRRRCGPSASLSQRHTSQEQQQQSYTNARRRTRFYPRWGGDNEAAMAVGGATLGAGGRFATPTNTLHFEQQRHQQQQQSQMIPPRQQQPPSSSGRFGGVDIFASNTAGSSGSKASPTAGSSNMNAGGDQTVGRNVSVRGRESGGVGVMQASTAAAEDVVDRSTTDGEDVGANRKNQAGRKKFNGIRASSFQHPFDQEATAMLRRLPGLELAIRSAVPAIEDAVYMDNIANSILVGPNQMASLYALLVEACRILDISQVPDMYIRQNPVPNAYTLAIRGKKPFIVLHTALVDLMEPEEVQAVIAHELGHLKCEHGIWVTLATVLANGLYRGGFLGAFLADRLGLRRLLMRWSRAAEFTCDRAAMLVAQDVNVVVSTLLKLAGGSVSQASELSVPEFLNQASAYDLASKTRIGQLLKNSQSEELTHPLPVVRARELVKFSKSAQYLGLLRRGESL